MKIAIIGRGEFMYKTALRVIEAGFEIPVIITSKEAKEYKYGASDFESLSRKINAAYLYTPKINSDESRDKIKSLGEIDIALSVNYTGIIDSETINLFRLGILNAHAGDLPRYRGNACVAWAMINSEEKIGLCIHKMIGGELDSGDIISREYLSIDHNTRIMEVFDWQERNIPVLFLDAVSKLSENPGYYLEKQSLDPAKSLRCYPRFPDDGRILWSDSNYDVLRHINASSEPFSGAFTYLRDEKLIIWRAEIAVSEENYLAVPGQVAEICDDGSIIVITGDGKIRIQEVEFNACRCKPAEIISSIRTRLAV